MELGGLKTVPVMEAGWKGEERERERGEGGAETSTYVAGLNPGHHCDRLARSSQTWVTIPPTQAAGRPRGCLRGPPTGGGTAAPRKQSHIEKREGRSQPWGVAGGPCSDSAFPEFLGSRPPV